MAEPDPKILSQIQDIYVPFLKKLIAFLEKTKKASPENLNRLNSIYSIFTTASPPEQVETFHANRDKLEKWHQKLKDKGSDDGDPPSKASKRTLSDTDSSQGAFENSSPAPKRSTFKGAVSADSTGQSASIISKESNSQCAPIKTIPLSQIKKEKVDSPKKTTITPKVTEVAQPKVVPPKVVQPTKAAPSKTQVNESSNDDNDQVKFTCASCQFQTIDDAEFMKHARTDHRTDLSMWCKQCGKCFSNAGVLVSHIKERACVKEDMIYRCGVKACTFETSSGQTFVHHLRHCHKGSPFIFCVHCQKIFTLPHCLILHMQDDCPFKERNRKGGSSSATSEVSTPPKTTAPTLPVLKPQITTVTSAISKPPVVTPTFKAVSVRPVGVVNSPQTSQEPAVRSAPGRGRPSRGRKPRYRAPSSSDSDDPDDPSWRPEEPLGSTTLRRSGRWAKKVSDAVHVELSAEETSTKKNLSMSELDSNKMLNCPCCDFMATFQSVLEDHYIADHKVSNKNACLVCKLKFENTKLFLEHFTDHKKTFCQENTDASSNAISIESNASLIDSSLDNQQSNASTSSVESSTDNPPNRTKTNENGDEVICEQSMKKDFSLDNVILDGVVKKLTAADITNPASGSKVIIPYQAAIHDKNKKESKLKKFEDLKSSNDVISMKNEKSLINFFKCVLYDCTFTTNNTEEFSTHLDSEHSGKRLHCAYCFKEFFAGEILTKHILAEHSARKYQCSNCFYRGYSKIHVQIHIKDKHSNEENCEIYTCEDIEVPDDLKKAEVETLDTTWPYVCAIGTCTFNTFDPNEFKKHNETIHRSVSVFFCHYCKVDFISFKRLLNHYRLHGINTYQCTYCIHGSETNNEMMLHLCNDHADLPLKAFMRGSKDYASAEVEQLSVRNDEKITTAKMSPDFDVNRNDLFESKIDTKDVEKQEYEAIGHTYYPKRLHRICSDFSCGIPFCGMKFDDLLLYANHLRTSHAAVNFYCPHCPSVHDTSNDFNEHLQCHGPDLFACGLKECNLFFSSKSAGNEHIKTHSSDVKLIIVRECLRSNANSKSFDVTKLNSVAVESVKVDGKVFECPFCKYKSDNFKIMKNHMYAEMAYNRFSCSNCSLKCCSKKEITDHFTSSHPGHDIKCSIKQSYALECLVKKYLGQEGEFNSLEPTSKCSTCTKEFPSEIVYQNHLLTCVKKEYRPFNCNYCKSYFSDLNAVKYHIDENHFPKLVLYAMEENLPVEYEIDKNLREIRLKFLQDICDKANSKVDETKTSATSKYYYCSLCSFEADFKHNVENHIEMHHKNKNGLVLKSTQNLSAADNLAADESSNDSSKVQVNLRDQVKRYRCGFCIKKTCTIRELESHVESLHPVKDETEYFYYYWPDVKMNFSEKEKEIFECAYCKGSKGNLFTLKTHFDLMHSEAVFKVKGLVVRQKEQSSYLACGHCYLRIESNTELKRHSMAEHPKLPQKSIGNLRKGVKRGYEEVEENGQKRIKFTGAVYECSHCGGAFATQEQIASHSKQAHSRLKLDFKTGLQNSVEEGSKFYKCEFCQFIGTQIFLDKHLSTKHKTRVSCFYCKKRFEFATKLKEHHNIFHKSLPWKFSQETVNKPTENESKKNVFQEVRESEKEVSAQSNLDLSKITMQMDTKGGQTKVPVVYFAQLFDIYPKIILKRLKN